MQCNVLSANKITHIRSVSVPPLCPFHLRSLSLKYSSLHVCISSITSGSRQLCIDFASPFSEASRMTVSFTYWDECVDPEDLERMWEVPEVQAEWETSGEVRGEKVHLSRNFDGQPYLTQPEMMAVAQIVLKRHFDSPTSLEMLCTLAELVSGREITAENYDRKRKDTCLGVMQIKQKTAAWLVSEGYDFYQVEENSDLLFRPFVNVYLGAAYLQWLSKYKNIERNEEFIIRAYSGGAHKATSKSTLPFWERYLSVKDSLPFRKVADNDCPPESKLENVTETSQRNASPQTHKPGTEQTGNNGGGVTYWESRATQAEMAEMWNHSSVRSEWNQYGQKQGQVRFYYDGNRRLYLSQPELKGVADIIVSNHFSATHIRPEVLAALGEVVSLRYVDGLGQRPGIMGIDYINAQWLFREVGYRAYIVVSPEDLNRPFVSMYFGAAYYEVLSKYEGVIRTQEFAVKAYISGPQNVNFEEQSPHYQKFREALAVYEEMKREKTCILM